MANSILNDLLIELECPVCTTYMTPPIRQCATGHSICETCRNKLPKCALCQGKFTDSRNISLEGLAVKMRYPCINNPSGCHASLAYNEREVHELQCKYKGFHCAMEKCPWIGQLEDLASHWASKKIMSKPYHASNVCHTKMKAESYYVNIIEAYDKLFWFKCRLINKKLYWAVQYIGNKDEAENFYYEIEIFKSGRTKHKILISDYCQSIDIDNAYLLKEGSCISMSVEMIEEFVNEEQLLIYYMRVHPVHVKGSGTPKKDQKFNTDMKMRQQRDRSKGPPNQNRFKEFRKYNNNKNKEKQTDGFVVV